MPPPGPTGPTGWCKVAFERATELRKSGAIAQQILDDARRTCDVALASLEATRTTQVTAPREVSVQSPAVSAAGAAIGRAKYDLDRTVIVAPVSGRVAPLIVRAGDYLTAGRPAIQRERAFTLHTIAELGIKSEGSEAGALRKAMKEKAYC